jgi:hypothetical protein
MEAGNGEPGLSLFTPSTRHFEAVIQETSCVEENYAALREARITTLGDIPLVVLSAPDQFSALARFLSAEDLERTKEVANELSAELAALPSTGKQVIVKESRHYIQVDRPQVVIDTIREVVEAVREQG